jgi:hypothetical protein
MPSAASLVFHPVSFSVQIGGEKVLINRSKWSSLLVDLILRELSSCIDVRYLEIEEILLGKCRLLDMSSIVFIVILSFGG